MAPRILPPQDYLRQCFDYDPETGALTWRERPREHFDRLMDWKTWNTKFAGQPAGKRSQERRMVAIRNVRWLTSRIIWKIMTGNDPIEVDHRNLNKRDERWENLRDATRTQNGSNRDVYVERDLPKGVIFFRGKFRAQIKKDKVHYVLGDFDTAQEAHFAYREAAKRLHGEFAHFGTKND